MTNPSSLRLTFVCPSMVVGGAERHWRLLVPALRDLGFTVHLLLLDRGGPWADELVELGIPVTVLSGRLSLARAVWAARRQSPDLLVTRGPSAHLVGFLAQLGSSRKWVVNWHRNVLQIRPRARLLLRAILRTSNLVVAVHEAQRELLSDRLQVAEGRIAVIANGVPSNCDAPLDRQSLGLTDTDVVVILVAALRPEKRPDVFVRALALAQARQPRLRGLLVGDGPERAQAEALAVELGAPVAFLGQRSDVPALLRTSDIFCLTSDTEAAPMAILEALAAGLPVVATDVGGIAELLGSAGSGFVVPAGDHAAIAEHLLALAGDEAQRRTLGERAARHHAATHTVEHMAREYGRAFQSLFVDGKETP